MRSLRIAYSQRCPSLLLSASLFLVCLNPTYLHSHQAYAANEDSIAHEDHNHPRILDVSQLLSPRRNVAGYEPEFLGFDRSIIGRAEEDNTELVNNVPSKSNINQGESQYWTFLKQSLSGPKEPSIPDLPSSLQNQPSISNPGSPAETILYISLNTCIQPTPKTGNSDHSPAQLTFFVSTRPSSKQPDAANSEHVVPVNGGFGSLNLSVTSDVYVGISAPTNDDYTGIYNYQLTASVNGPFASYYENPNLVFIDSDINSALLYTNNVTSENSSSPIFQKWMNGKPPFSIFVTNQDNPLIQGVQNSLCALQNFANVHDPEAIDTGMTLIGNGKAKQQFHVRNLNASSSYFAYAAIVGNSTDKGDRVVGGGGTLWSPTVFNTKSDANCALVYNLTFCTTVAYSAPANLTKISNITALGQLYDEFASSHYLNFSRSLEQIPCNTTSSAQYSLTRNCTDCDTAYKKWLCAVTIPRCEDFSNPAHYLQPRAVNQSITNSTLAKQSVNDPAFNDANKSRVAYWSSRNPWIDYTVQPGPYKEVLPCEDLCYDLVQSCPASLQFVCPLQNHGLNYTYGSRKGLQTGNLTCNYPEAGINMTSGTTRMETSAAWIAFGTALVAIIA